MRNLFFLFCTVAFAINPKPGLAQNKNIEIDNDMSISLEQVFELIQKQTDYRFIYRTEIIKKAPLVSLKKGRIKVDELLEKGLTPIYCVFEITENGTIIVKEKVSPNNFDQQDRKISGKVTSMVTKEPLIGVTIGVMEADKVLGGVVTDFDGNFSFSITSKITRLRFSMIGFKTKYITLTESDTYNIQLEESLEELKEVYISTGIFERKAKSFTGAATVITKDDLVRVGNINVLQAIQNIDPSMVILDNLEMGSNPNALPELQMRGTSTFPIKKTSLAESLKGNFQKSPNQPLFVLNGFEASIEQVFDLDINRIESVTLLKDAAAKAIYGSRAANGVVIIETEKLTSEKSIITYNASIDVEIPDLTSYNLTNSLEKIEAERIDGMYIPKFNDAEDYARLQQLYNYRKKLALEGLDTDWMAKPLQIGIGQRHSITAELGGDDLRILGNISYRDAEGVMIGSFRKNISGSLTTSYRLDNLSFKNIMSVNSNNAEDSPYGDFGEYSKMNPYWRAKELDGTIPYYAEIGPNGERYTNPLFNSTLNSKIASSYFNFINNFYFEWLIIPELKATTRIGVNVKNSDADEFYPSNHTKFESTFSSERKGSYQINSGKSSNLSGDININYNKTINKHFFFANIGFNISEFKYKEVAHKVEGFPSNLMDNIIFGRDYALDSRPTGIDGVSRDLGFLSVASYSYDDRFLTDLTFRKSASSQFGADKRWANFWSLGMGWNLHNEKLLEGSILDQLKIRGSLGSTGNQNFNTNASIATYSYYLESLYQGFTGSYLQNMANSGLQWETKFDYNVGLDAKIKHLSMRFDYYESFTENLITDITIPASTGFDMVKDNLGKIKNSGIEANASYLLYAKDRNFFSIHGSLSTNKNKIMELSDAMKSFNKSIDEQASDKGNSQPLHKYEDGMSMNAIWAVKSLGIDPSTGNEIYLDRDGNTTYEWKAEDMVVVGNSNPSYSGNFGFNGEYKRVGLSVTCRYLGGGQMYNQTLVDKVENVDMNYNVDRRVLTGRWLYPGQVALYKRLGTYGVDPEGDNTYVYYNEKTRATSRFVQDRRDLDIAAINVYYDFNDQLVKNLGLERLKLSFNMNDVIKISSIKIERGTQYPFTRTMSFSLSATF